MRQHSTFAKISESLDFRLFQQYLPITDIATRSSPTRFSRKKAHPKGALSISNLMIADHASINGFDFRR
jgi:hypothetical protein